MWFSRSFACFPAAFAFSFLINSNAGADVNETVKKLMPLLVPVKASKKNNPNDFKNAQTRMIRILEFMENVEGSYGRDAKHILTNAFYIYDRDRFSGHRRMMTEATITQCWEKARELGLFDKRNKNKFGFMIRNGREEDKKAKFEYIIPPNKNAGFSTDLANLRLVAPSEKRKSEKLTPAEIGHLENLAWIEKEVLEGRPDEMGRTPVENLALWKAEVKKTGDAFKKAPLLRIGGKLTATPSSLSGNRWRVNFEASNLSRHPTEVTVEYFLFGMASRGGQIYRLKNGKKVLRLRSSESHDFDIWSDERIGAVGFRGWAIQVRHNGKLIAKTASQPIIAELIPKVGTFPRMGNKNTGSKGR